MTNEERYRTLGAGTGQLIDKFKSINSDRADNSASDWVSRKTHKHSGSFSANNPYFKQLDRAGSRSDEDALFELAVKWEAEQAGYQQERADKFADLQEQRAYDDPSAVVSRNRRAGINSDLVGASGAVGSGSGSGVTADMPSLNTPTENTSKFSNAYDSTSLIINSISAVGNLFSSLSSVGSTIINGVTSLSMLPIHRKAGKLANDLSEMVNPLIVDNTKKQGDLLDTQITGQNKANSRSHFAMLNDSLKLTDYLSQLIPDGTSDVDSSNILSALGFNSDEIPRFQNLLKQRYTNPHFKAWYENSVAAERQATSYNKVYTNSVIERSFELKNDLDVATNQLSIAQAEFANRVQTFLNTDEYASDVADLTKTETNVSKQRLGYESDAIAFADQQLERDVDAFISQLEYLKQAKAKSQSILDSLSAKDTLTGFEQAVYDTEEQRILLYDQLGSQYLGDAKIMVQNAIANTYHVNQNHLSQAGYSTFVGVGITPGYPNFFNDRISFTEFSKGNVSTDDIKLPFVDALKRAYQYKRSLPTNPNGSLSNPTMP